MIRAEVDRRYADAARIDYIDVGPAQAQEDHREMVAQIEERGLTYPVTVIDGQPVYDGAVSFPAILRAVEIRVEQASEVTKG